MATKNKKKILALVPSAKKTPEQLRREMLNQLELKGVKIRQKNNR